MSFESVGRALLAIRLFFGITGWLAPRAAARLFGVAPEENRATALYGRLFATRELFVASTLLALAPEQRGAWLRANAAIDVADAATGAMSALRREVPVRAALLIAASALGDAYLIARVDPKGRRRRG
jgi:hypothetical protein